MLAIQYLEHGSGVAAIAPAAARARLRAAFERLPLSLVLLGWNLPPALFDACREETTRAGARLFRWHPLLSGDGTFMPRPEWQTIGLDGQPIPGFHRLLEFTFVCPNRPAVREAALSHLRNVIRCGSYQGVFLDRIRYPSPAADPARLLGCFCQECCRVAAAEGLDLEQVRRRIQALLAMPGRVQSFIQALLDPSAIALPDPDLTTLRAFLGFRARSVTGFVQAAAELAHGEGLEVGLDCFSPALTAMVGQDLPTLDLHCEWIKIMVYGHTLGPAGLPFELLGLAGWLVTQLSVGETEALEWLSRAAHLPLPLTFAALREQGLEPEALAAEIQRARDEGVSMLLAGVELVEIEGIARLNPAQIAADLHALRGTSADGLVLSWDLWHMPLERLELARLIWAQ